MLGKRKIFTHFVPTTGEDEVHRPDDGSEDHDGKLAKRHIIFTHLVPTFGEDMQKSLMARRVSI